MSSVSPSSLPLISFALLQNGSKEMTCSFHKLFWLDCQHFFFFFGFLSWVKMQFWDRKINILLVTVQLLTLMNCCRFYKHFKPFYQISSVQMLVFNLPWLFLLWRMRDAINIMQALMEYSWIWQCCWSIIHWRCKYSEKPGQTDKPIITPKRFLPCSAATWLSDTWDL